MNNIKNIEDALKPKKVKIPPIKFFVNRLDDLITVTLISNILQANFTINYDYAKKLIPLCKTLLDFGYPVKVVNDFKKQLKNL